MTTKNNNGLTGLTPETFYAENSSGTTDFQMSADFIKLNYDKTTTPTEFKISPSGLYWNNGTSNYTTGLGKVAALETVLASVRLPPNSTTLEVDNTLELVDSTNPQFTSTHRNDYLIIQDTVNGDYYSFNQNTLQVNEPSQPSYISMSPQDGLHIQNDVKGGSPTLVSTISYSQVQLDNSLGGGPTATMTQGDLTIYDYGANATSQLTSDYLTVSNSSGQVTTVVPTSVQVNDPTLTLSSQLNTNSLQMLDGVNNLQLELSNDINVYPEPTIRMQNNTGLNNYISYSGINADGHYNFTLNNNERFFKQMNPFSFNVYHLNDGDTIERYMPFVMTEGAGNIVMRPPTDYLDDNGNTGWSIIVSNMNGSDITIDTGGYQWYAHNVGLSGSPIDIKKWVTCRITLVLSLSLVNDFVYAVSQF